MDTNIRAKLDEMFQTRKTLINKSETSYLEGT